MSPRKELQVVIVTISGLGTTCAHVIDSKHILIYYLIMGEEMGRGRDKTILLIEDNPKLNQMIRETVQNNFEDKVKIISFYDSTSAIDYLRGNVDKICLIITCRLLHAGNGFRLLHECKTLNPDLPVILHTALVCKDKFSPFDECIEKQTGFSPPITAISELLKI